MASQTSRIQIPTLTMIIMASRLSGYPVISKSELLDFIQQYPTISLEVPNNTSKANENIKQSKKLNLLNSSNTALIDANNIKELYSILNNNEKLNSINETVKSKFIDFNYEDEFDTYVLATSIDFGLINCTSENYCDVDTTVSLEEFLYILAKTKFNKENIDEEYIDKFGDTQFSGMISNLYKENIIDFDVDINPYMYKRGIQTVDAIYLIIKELCTDVYNSVNISTVADTVSSFNYEQLLNEYEPDKIKALYFAENNNIIEHNMRPLDDEITKFEILRIIIKALTYNR